MCGTNACVHLVLFNITADFFFLFLSHFGMCGAVYEHYYVLESKH